MLRRIGAEEGGEFKAIASGTLPCGRPVVVNADGTVSSVSQSTQTQAAGTSASYESDTNGSSKTAAIVHDPTNNKILVVYGDAANSDYGTAVVGTVSGTSISFGTPVVFESAYARFGSNQHQCATFIDDKIVIVYGNGGNSNVGTAIHGTISGTSITFSGSTPIFNSGNTYEGAVVCTDTVNDKVIIAYRDEGNSNYGNAIVGTINGASISFGSEHTFRGAAVQSLSIAFDESAGAAVVAYRTSSGGQCNVLTVSGTNVSGGATVTFNSAASTTNNNVVYDSNAQKTVITYVDGGNSSYGTAIVGTVSGTSISFGSEVVYNAATTAHAASAFDSNINRIVVAYSDGGSVGNFTTGIVSGDSITFGQTETQFAAFNVFNTVLCFDSTNKKCIVAYMKGSSSYDNLSAVLTPEGNIPNLTSENYIGMSRGVAVQTGSASTTSSEITFESATTSEIFSAYDTNSDRVVITYRDHGNSDYGTAVVGNVSGSSITFGTPVVYYSNLSQENSVVFDSSNNKIVISWIAWDVSNNRNGTSIVGTVSGTSISFGSATQFNTTETTNIGSVFDSSNNKVVVAYRDLSNSNVGTARVGTVSGTSISFGSEVVFENAATSHVAQPVFDSSNNKVVLAYQDQGNSNYGTAIVGTVSGTSISFGSPVLFAGNTACTHMEMAFDTSVNKVVMYYVDDSDNTIGKAIVGTVSGTSISFGSPVNINGSSAGDKGVVIYDSNANRHVIFFRDEGDSNKGKVVSGLVSGTSISFSDAETISDGNTGIGLGQTFDPDQNKVILTFDAVSNAYGTAVLHTPSTIATTRGQVTNGQAASVDVIGSVSSNQIGLTAGQQYFVQNDGTISTTADSPSVLAGTAISATELVVKT